MLLIVVISLYSVQSAAQSLQIIDTRNNYEVDIAQEISSSIKIKNLSDHPITLGYDLTESIIGSSQSFQFCWNNECLKTIDQPFSAPITINPGEILENLSVKLNSGIEETFSTLAFRFYDVNDPDDFTSIEINYQINEPSHGLLYQNDDLIFSDIYPNPIIETGYLEYQIMDTGLEVKIVIHNVLGSVITEYELNPLERMLKINTQEFRPGVYFYSLYVDNEGKVTKKMVIRN